MAFVFLGIASVGFTGDPFWLFSQATKWIAAGVLALIGIGLLVTTLPGARRRALNPEHETSAPFPSRPSRRKRRRAAFCGSDHSHSMVPGGLLVTSSTTRLTSGTSPVIRLLIVASRSYGMRDQSAVIASSLDTGRSTIGWP